MDHLLSVFSSVRVQVYIPGSVFLHSGKYCLHLSYFQTDIPASSLAPSLS